MSAMKANLDEVSPDPGNPYLRLKVALEFFRKPPHALSRQESEQLAQVTARQAHIEAAILTSPEASRVAVPEASRAARLTEIRGRYPDHAEFLSDMRANGLDEAALEIAIARDLIVEAVLEGVAAKIPEISETEAETYYHRHPQAFTRPETRRLRHILVTFRNDAQKEEGMRLLTTLRSDIRDSHEFAAAALRHSHCPTALEEGVIGTVGPGQLYPELEAHAFALAEGELSAPLESPVGLHLVFCEQIHPARNLSFSESKPHIIARLTEARRKKRQQAWIKHRVQAWGIAGSLARP
ncbi:MAG: nitrogen fixation protein NifM [Zoogloeaceae bacterium]|jgi:peptidylprolyl isomerase/peptidyl-prolyl cis-trans isomerase C|nr:nitrogen fixation protein NifM [Zoogloeaceae bacterium]